MTRVVSLYFPRFPTDRIRRARTDANAASEAPTVVVGRHGSKRTVVALDHAASKAGLRVGMAAAKAQALVTGLVMHDADQRGDLAALERLSFWVLHQYTPVVAMDAPDGIVFDTEGADHLRGGELSMLTGLVNALRAKGVEARAAIADTWGAAHGIARVTEKDVVVVPPGDTARFVSRLPISALRLPAETVDGLRKLGFESVGQLSAAPRATVTLRFGPEAGRRLDQAFGRVAEPIEPLRAPEDVTVSRLFQEPIAAAETIARYVARLVGQLCDELETKGLGVRRTDLIVHRVDNTIQSLRAGTAKPVRDAARLTRLLCDRIADIDPGFGIEKLSLTATMTEELDARQSVSSLVEATAADVTALLDVLGNRGGQRLYRLAPVDSDVPERSVRRVAPAAPETGATWSADWPRPTRLFARPEEIEVMAVMPDHPPAVFTWRGKRRRVKRADGPERVFGEWWRRDAELEAVRDYFTVEDDVGERYWVYRAGDGVDSGTGSHRWFVHGTFA